MGDVTAADDLALHNLVGLFLIFHKKVDGLAVEEREQTLLRDRVVAVVLFEDLELPFAEGVAQDDAVGFDVSRGPAESDTVLARLQRQRKQLPYDREVLVVDGERRAFVLRGEVIFALLCEGGKRKYK